MTQILPAKLENISKVAKLLQQGEVVAFPTETVYGLGADASNPEAVNKIYKIKQRPSFNPLIAHYSDFHKITKDVIVNDFAIKLAEKFCPGPLTFVLPKTADSRISNLASANLATAAVRIPAHPVTQQLLALLDIPIVAPSANPSTRVSPVSAQQVYEYFNGSLDWILEGGFCDIGLESTIIDLTLPTPKILRYGKITPEQICEVIGGILLPDDKSCEIKAPGMMLKHYSPKTKLRLTTLQASNNEALLAFGSENIPQGFVLVKNLSPSGDLEEAARNLFKYIYELDQMNLAGIAVMPIPDIGVGRAINDRLRRAAS